MQIFPLTRQLSDLEMMPVLSSCEYPWEESSYMPFMAARIAFVEQLGAVFDLFSFDTNPVVVPDAESPLDDHIVAAVFNFFPKSSARTVGFVANSATACRLYLDGEDAGELPCQRSLGEDERGIYWHVRVTLPCSLLEQVYGEAQPHEGADVLGNIFKAKRTGPGAHLGAVAPAAKEGFLFEAESRVPFRITRL